MTTTIEKDPVETEDGFELAPDDPILAELRPAEEIVADEPEPTAEPADKGKGKEKGKEPAATGRMVPEEALHAERGKRKAATDKWREVEARKNELEARLNAPRPRVLPPGSKLLTDADLKRIRDSADKAEGFGDVAEQVIKEATQVVTTIATRVDDALYHSEMKYLENLARIKHADYDRVIKASGLLASVTVGPNGQAADPVLARDIFSDANPPERLYELAMGKLESEGKLDEIRGSTPPADPEPEAEPTPARPERPARGAAPAAPRVPANPVEAAREAERRVIDKVVTNANRPRGISGVPSAGAPRARITRADIDRMPDEQVRKLFDERPEVREWYLSGGPS